MSMTGLTTRVGSWKAETERPMTPAHTIQQLTKGWLKLLDPSSGGTSMLFVLLMDKCPSLSPPLLSHQFSPGINRSSTNGQRSPGPWHQERQDSWIPGWRTMHSWTKLASPPDSCFTHRIPPPWIRCMLSAQLGSKTSAGCKPLSAFYTFIRVFPFHLP